MHSLIWAFEVRICPGIIIIIFFIISRQKTDFDIPCKLSPTNFINFQSFVVFVGFFFLEKKKKTIPWCLLNFLPSMISFNILTEHCEEGKQYNWTSGGCDPCEKGFFKANRSSRETCIPCPINTVTRRKGADRCEGSLCSSTDSVQSILDLFGTFWYIL